MQWLLKNMPQFFRAEAYVILQKNKYLLTHHAQPNFFLMLSGISLVS